MTQSHNDRYRCICPLVCFQLYVYLPILALQFTGLWVELVLNGSNGSRLVVVARWAFFGFGLVWLLNMWFLVLLPAHV